LHFLVRFLGLTGFVVACVGLVMAGLEGLLGSWRAAYDTAWAAVTTREAAVSTWLVLGGAAAALLALVVEALVVLVFAAGRRSAFGFNAVVQVALAATLLVGINVFSFEHFQRFDWTRSRQFTLPPALRAELEQLHPDTETKVIVYQRHKTFGALTDKPDRYDYAAERKVVEKIKDLVEQFRELGKRFDVQVLDVEEEGFDDKLNHLAAPGTRLRQAIDAAPENSLFLAAGDHVQQMSFNELFLLDRKACVEANGGRGNLVLLAQGSGESGRGVEPFAHKVLNLEEHKPRVGVLVLHEYLTTEGPEDAFTLSGLRKGLERHGFEVRDVVLRRFADTGLTPAADTPEESKLNRLTAKLDELGDEIRKLQRDIQQAEPKIKAVEAKIADYEADIADLELKPGENEQEKLERLSQKYARQLGGRRLTSKDRQFLLGLSQSDLLALRAELKRLQDLPEQLKDIEREKEETAKERQRLPVSELEEAQRLETKAKLDRALADCDLLFIPRLTRRQNGSVAAPYRFHRLYDMQLAGVREWLSRGKPLFVCLGPPVEPSETQADGLDMLLADLGLRLIRQTIVYSADSKWFSRRPDELQAGDTVKVPPLDFEAPTAVIGTGRLERRDGPRQDNRLREALRVLAHGVGDGFDLRVRFPRPVYFGPDPAALDYADLVATANSLPGALSGLARKYYFAAPESSLRAPAVDPVFLVTAEGWNEEQPFAPGTTRLRYEAPKPGDLAIGTFAEKRKGQFPVGIATEVPLPADWASYPPKTVRLAVIGQGDVFVGSQLAPAKEQLFLQTANWLLRRDDSLPRADHPWSYPRVALMPGSLEEQLWQWGTRLGLPVLFAYLGLVVLLVRRLR
jgi:hypothetical protein